MAGLRAFHGTQMKVSSHMLLRNPIPPNLHLIALVIKRIALQIRIAVAGRVKASGKRTGERLMLGNGSLLSLLLMFRGIKLWIITLILDVLTPA